MRYVSVMYIFALPICLGSYLKLSYEPVYLLIFQVSFAGWVTKADLSAVFCCKSTMNSRDFSFSETIISASDAHKFLKNPSIRFSGLTGKSVLI